RRESASGALICCRRRSFRAILEPPVIPGHSTRTNAGRTRMKMARQVIVVGDKVLIKPEDEAARTPSGLFLPQGVAEKETVYGGYIVNVGPGYPTADVTTDGEP